MTLKGDAGKRLDHFLQEQLTQFSRSRLQSWIKEGRVLVNGVGGQVVAACCAAGERVDVSPGGSTAARSCAGGSAARNLVSGRRGDRNQ